MSELTDTVDAYIARAPVAVQPMLRAVRAAVREAAPGAEERISYRMPALFQDGVLVYYGAFTHHLGLFPPVADPVLQAQAARYAGPKGNLQFPYREPMPLELIAAIVRSRMEANAAKKAATRRRHAQAPARGARSADGSAAPRSRPARGADEA